MSSITIRQKNKKVHFNTKHGMDGTPEYRAWVAMRNRCEKKNNPAYKNYGGRGIKVCDQWHKFEGFYADMGKRPKGRSLDRINNDGNYEIGNCRWATKQEQNSNKRNPKPRDKSYLLTNCQICKKEFFADTPSHLKKAKYCNRTCWIQARALPRGEKIATNCGWCNRGLLLTPYYVKKKNYCSPECYQSKRTQKE